MWVVVILIVDVNILSVQHECFQAVKSLINLHFVSYSGYGDYQTVLIELVVWKEFHGALQMWLMVMSFVVLSHDSHWTSWHVDVGVFQ